MTGDRLVIPDAGAHKMGCLWRQGGVCDCPVGRVTDRATDLARECSGDCPHEWGCGDLRAHARGETDRANAAELSLVALKISHDETDMILNARDVDVDKLKRELVGVEADNTLAAINILKLWTRVRAAEAEVVVLRKIYESA